MTGRVLVAGVGNVFLADDGFGVELARRLAREPWPAHVEVADFGIRGLHLAYQLLDGYDTLVLLDAHSRGGPPGTVYVLEVDERGPAAQAPADAHALDPWAVLGHVRALGGSLRRVLVVGCEPAEIEERMGLSPTVAAAVEEAAAAVRRLLGGPDGVPAAPGRA